ncbi:MAG TPA: 6-hydroxymethylpterin diphosphokinase MptE-like protein [Spirochaetota bacterium]
MSDYFLHALESLRRSHPESGEKVRLASSAGITPVATSDGDSVPQVRVGERSLLLHSKFDPRTEARRFLSSVTSQSYTLYVVAGFGYGYHCEILLDTIPSDATLLILEKDAAIVRSAMENRKLDSFFSDPRVILLVDPTEDEIAERMRGRSSKSVVFIAHRGSCLRDGEYYPNIIRIAKSYISTKDVNIATLAKFEKLWSSNIARNAKSFLSAVPVSAFFGAFENVPAIVVAAGPSLTESIPFIRKNKDRAVIIAVDTSYFILRRYGIEPHFCLCVDPQAINARYFEGDTSGETVLVADPCAHPSALRLFTGRQVMAGIPFDMMKWIEEISGEKGELAHGGSVSTNAYDFAKQLGASPVIIVGQDLAFSDGLAHARGSYLDEQSHLRVTRLWNEQMMNRSQLSALPKIMVKGIGGEKVHTNQKMMIFLNWFEKRNDDDFINATRKGSFINGARQISDDQIDLPPTSDISSRISSLFDSARITDEKGAAIKKEAASRVESMIAGALNLKEKLERAQKLSSELSSIMEKDVRDSGKVSYILGKLSDIDRELDSSGSVKDMVGLTVQRVIHTITEGYDAGSDGAKSDDHAVALRSQYLYRGLLEGTLFSLRILNRMKIVLSRTDDMCGNFAQK